MFCLVLSDLHSLIMFVIMSRCVKGRNTDDSDTEFFSWHDNGFLLIAGLTAYWRTLGRCEADVRKLSFEAVPEKERQIKFKQVAKEA